MTTQLLTALGALLLVSSCNDYNCADYANCSTPQEDAGSATESGVVSTVERLQPVPTATGTVTPSSVGTSTTDSTSMQGSTDSDGPVDSSSDDPRQSEPQGTTTSDAPSTSEHQDSTKPSIPPACDDGEFLSGNDCDPATTCGEEEYEVQAPSPTTDRVCAPVAPCEPNTYETTAATETSDRVCSPLTVCTPGYFVASPGTATTDTICAPCPSATYSSTINADACVAWSRCDEGETESVPPGATSDRVCSACGTGKYESSGQCLAITSCSQGEYETAAPTATSDRQCSSIKTCEPGEMQIAPPTANSDRVCAPCAGGSFSTTTNAQNCQVWTSCTPGAMVEVQGSPTRDRSCGDCAAGTYSSRNNVDSCTACTSGFAAGSGATSCTPWTTCDASTQYQNAAPTATTDRVCTSLTTCGGKDSGGHWIDNQYVSKEPTSTTDRECKPCPGDSKNRGENQTSCYQVTAGDSHTCYLNTGVSDILAGDGVVTNVRCWGNTAGNRTKPPANKFVSISAGPNFTCGLLEDSTVRCWGANANIAANPRPNVKFTKISAGNDSACGIKTDGHADCWGANDAGQATPPSAATVYDIIDGGIAMCGRVSNTGYVECWGNPFAGAGSAIDPDQANQAMLDISSGGYTSSLLKTPVAGFRPIYYWGIVAGNVFDATPTDKNFKDIEGSGLFMCGIIDSPSGASDEQPWCWTSDTTLADQVNNPFLKPAYRVLQLSAGYSHVCALNEFGRPACWGDDTNGDTAVPADL